MTTTEESPITSTVSDWMEQQSVQGRSVSLSVIVPAFNEERRLPPTLIDMIDYLDTMKLSYEIIVVDDGSNDLTAQVVRKFERVRSQVRLIQLPKNTGKGHAVRVGVLNSHGDRVLFADADGATLFTELSKLQKSLDTGADIAIGSRALQDNETKVTTVMHRKVLGRMFNFFVNRIVLPGVADTQCGFKLFKRNIAQFVFKHQRADRFSFDVEVLYIAQRIEAKIAEIPVNWTNVPGSKVNLIRDALKMFRDILKFRLRHRSIRRQNFLDEFPETPESGLLSPSEC